MTSMLCALARPCESSQAPSTQPATKPESQASTTQPAERRIHPFNGVLVIIHGTEGNSVEIIAETCLDVGWLEQIACAPGSREHESLLVVKPQPSQIHAALLMAGFEPGSPGRWTYEDQKLGTIDPTGDKIDVRVRYARGTGEVVEHSVREWIRDGAAPGDVTATQPGRAFPKLPWVFGGSVSLPSRQPGENAERYAADLSGSVIGLVTFGDEVVGFSRVRSDQEEVQPPEWEANTPAMPPVGTEVTIVLRRWQEHQ